MATYTAPAKSFHTTSLKPLLSECGVIGILTEQQEWCGDSSFEKSGYSSLTEEFADTNIPVFFSEYGCNNVKPRTFTNVPVLYGDQMSVLSGGLVYEYSQESDEYGLVAINSSTEVTLLQDCMYKPTHWNSS